MSTDKHIIIFSHGSGVRKDDRGLLSGIADSLPEITSILFDYYEIDEENKTLTTCPISDSAKKLNRVVEEVRLAHPDAIIDLIGHSQGTVVAALAKPDGIRKAILLAPVFDLSLERTLKRYRTRPDAHIDLEGISTAPALDGLTRIIPASYWKDRLSIDSISEYNAFAEKTEIIVIEANQDELLPKVDLTGLNSKIKLISLDGDHGFNGKDRAGLLSVIKGLLL